MHEVAYVYVHNHDYYETDFSIVDRCMLCGRADNSIIEIGYAVIIIVRITI